MTPTIMSWFYSSPGSDAYQIAERVRLTLWDAGLGDAWLDVVSAQPPYKMSGVYKNDLMGIEWVPGEWFRLRLQAADESVVKRMSFVLGIRPVLRFVDSDAQTVWEWHIDDFSERWREISGNPAYQEPKRFT